MTGQYSIPALKKKMSRDDLEHQMPSNRNDLFTGVMRVGPLEKYERKEEEERHFLLPIERSGKLIFCVPTRLWKEKKKPLSLTLSSAPCIP